MVVFVVKITFLKVYLSNSFLWEPERYPLGDQEFGNFTKMSKKETFLSDGLNRGKSSPKPKIMNSHYKGTGDKRVICMYSNSKLIFSERKSMPFYSLAEGTTGMERLI